MLGNQRLELADDVALVPERELGLDPQFDCGEAKLLETCGLVPAEGFSELGEGGAARERKGAGQQLLAFGGLFCESACRASVTERSNKERSSSSSPTSSR